MSLLPKIETPTYTVKLPISEKTVKYRPYLVKEQKILSIAKESGDKNTLVDAILQTIENCVLDTTNARELPLTDVEFLFYTLRARSESEIVELNYKCENIIDHENNKRCNNIMKHDLNLLTDLDVINSNVSPLIQVNENIGLKLKHQRFEHDTIGDKIPTPHEILSIIANNVEFIYDEQSSYNAKDIPIQNIIDWIGDLPIEQYNKIENFFDNEPKIVKKLSIKCNKCGFDHSIVVEDIFDFFI
jgi:hypothetical protein